METPRGTASYTYDTLEQLTSEHLTSEGLISKRGPTTHTYSYDSHFNRIEKDGEPSTYNALNQIDGARYDRDGNLAQSGNIVYDYDELDRLIRIKTPQNVFMFNYDSFNRRITKEVYDEFDQYVGKFFYLYDGQNEIGCIDPSGTLCELRVLGATPTAETGAAIAIELKGEVFAPIADLQGNVVALVDLSGKIRERYQYTSFGEHTAETHLANPWRFASKRLDETGLIYYGRRYYDPKAGRWTTPDPLGFGDGINLYAFVKNNPLNHLDLYGLELYVNPPPLERPWVGAPFIERPWVGPPPMIIDPPKVGPPPMIVNPLPIVTKRIAIEPSAATQQRSAAFLGSLSGAARYIIATGYGFSAFGNAALDLDQEQRFAVFQALFEKQSATADSINSWVTSTFEIHPSNPLFNSYSYGTELALEFGSIFMGIRGAAQGFLVFNRMGNKVPIQIPKMGMGEGIATKNVLNRAKIKTYLWNGESLSKKQIISDLESVGLQLRGKSPDGRFLEFQDKYGKTRIKIHPSDKRTPYNHLHVYDRTGNPLNKHLQRVDRRSADAHIPYGGD